MNTTELSRSMRALADEIGPMVDGCFRYYMTELPGRWPQERVDMVYSGPFWYSKAFAFVNVIAINEPTKLIGFDIVVQRDGNTYRFAAECVGEDWQIIVVQPAPYEVPHAG